MSQEADVVVVGGGVAGLAAAGLVARRGLRAVVLERSSGLGGRAATTVRDGFHMNLGGHALYRGGAAMRVLGDLGARPSGRPPSTGGGSAFASAKSHVLPTGATTLLRTRLFGARAKLEFGRLLTRLPRLDLTALGGLPLSAWLDENTSDPRVRAVVLALVQVSTYTNAPDQVSAAASLRQLRAAASSGVLYVDGGWQTLVDGLAAVARSTGARIETTGVVREVTPLGARWRVEQVDGASWSASAVILATGPRAAAKMLTGPHGELVMQWADACTPARTACLDVGLRSLPRPATTFALGLDAPLYFSVHSNAARLAPDGGALIHAMKYLAPADDHSPEEHARELDAWLDLCQPGWRDVLVTKRYLPDMIATNAIARAGERRPTPAVPGAPGLFVAGDWVGDGMLADASFASAEEAARQAVECALMPPLRATG